jgi:hypothetical protein
MAGGEGAMTEQLTLSGMDAPSVQPRPRRHADMLRLYGLCPGRQCGQCAHLVRRRYARTYLKCEVAGETASAATDWRARWDACGKWEERW